MLPVHLRYDAYIPYARHYNPLLNTNHCTLEYKPYIKEKFSEKISLKKRFWPSKSGFKVYKPRVIIAYVRTVLNLRNLVDRKPFQSCSLSIFPIKYFCHYSTNKCAYIILINNSFFSLIIMWTLIKQTNKYQKPCQCI